jgi:formylglycine-generating enzyme required for sulfatase activity
VARLAEHVRVQVPYLAQRYGKGPQNPYLMAEPVSKQNLILLPQQASPADLMALKYAASQAENQGDRDLARDFWWRVLAIRGSDLEARQAIERLAAGRPVERAAETNAGSRSAIPNPPPVISRRRMIQLGWGGLGVVGFGLAGKVWSDGQGPKPTLPVPSTSPTASELPTAKPSPSETPKPPETKPSPSESPKPTETKSPSSVKLENFEFKTVQLSDRGEITKRETLQGKLFSQKIDGDISLAMVQMPAGKFLMGSPASEKERSADEGPQHEVSVPAFFIAQTLVTQAQWRAVAKLPKVKADLNPEPSGFKGDQRPVEQVSWWEAQEFCDRLSKSTGVAYRLPSEAEWEYACRSGTTMPFHFGETIITDVANYDDNYIYGNGPKGKYLAQTTDVATYPANAWGLYDMHGNAWEWCADHWHDNYKDAPTNGSAWLSGKNDADRLLRGGSWSSDPDRCRAANRYHYVPAYRSRHFGFRVVCASPAQAS